MDLVRDDFQTQLQKVQATFQERPFHLYKPISDFPELFVTIPDSWNSVQLAPWYDVHIGSNEHDKALFHRHRQWMIETENVISWNGGDMQETLLDPKMGHTKMSPEEETWEATLELAPCRHKMAFAMPGNHEDRTGKHAGTSIGRRLADNLQVPYFSDYAFVTFKWRGNNFRMLAHHGAGGAQTPGAQRNSARKELVWAKPDILWTGHLHQPMVDPVYMTDYDQSTGRLYERGAVVIISPSYLKYFGGYAAKMRMAPGLRGLTVAELQEDGRIDINVHARGKRI